jgi:hypothetical protein
MDKKMGIGTRSHGGAAESEQLFDMLGFREARSGLGDDHIVKTQLKCMARRKRSQCSRLRFLRVKN